MFVILAAALQAIAPPPACAGPEHGQFDFWVGSWDVSRTGSDELVARSRIEKLYGGCAVRESWMPLKGPGGGSLSSYYEGRWRQTWVDSSNSRVEFAGGLVDGAMVLLGDWKGVNGPGRDALIRMRYSRNADGSVRQLGEQSVDHGLSWSSRFDFTYRPSGADRPAAAR